MNPPSLNELWLDFARMAYSFAKASTFAEASADEVGAQVAYRLRTVVLGDTESALTDSLRTTRRSSLPAADWRHTA